ncbi:hypothetical protein [Neorhizobium tomejilense]|uniref:hypothetical protein n=1 Tax=Neorhizobium tomejilense TaxID=2093828 RepID=UPI003ED05B31
MIAPDDLAGLRGIPEIDAILKRASALPLNDSIYQIFRSRNVLGRHEWKAGMTDPRPYVFHESPLFCWMKIANPGATDGEIVEGFELTIRLEQAYGRCVEEITHRVGKHVPITTRESMVVQLLQNRFPMFSEKTVQTLSQDGLRADR